jgi:hypothetical protein
MSGHKKMNSSGSGVNINSGYDMSGQENMNEGGDLEHYLCHPSCHSSCHPSCHPCWACQLMNR